jgi:uncharacterized protein YhfF
MAKAKTQVAKKADQMPAYIKQEEGRGSENVTTDDVQIPRISLIQDLSPQIKATKPEYIEGAKPGMVFNVLTGELYPDGLKFVPTFFEKDHLVWKIRKAGGGLIARCETAQEAQALADTKEEYEYVEAPNHISILLDADGNPECEVSIPMATSKAKVSRRLNSLVRLNGGDRFSRVYKLISVEDESPSGEYWNFAIENVGWPSEEAYLAAEKLYDQITSGTKRYSTDYSDAKEGSEAESEY